MPTGTPPPTDWQLYHMHKERARAAYVAYETVQSQIAGYEERIGKRFNNDREAAAFLGQANPDDPKVWIYQQLCKHRAIHQTVIAMETAMASLYRP